MDVVELLPGTIVGAWKVSTPLGKGGQGSVWAVKPLKTKHTPQRALKACFATGEQERARFAREVELLGRCCSPHILQVFDSALTWDERVPGLPPFAYYVAEKCEGSWEVRQRSLGDARRRLDLFRQACAGVHYLHGLDEPILHRDIKPENFLIAKDPGKVVLADFGIAKAISSSALTEAHEVVGTVHYRAPEVANGGPASVASDVYSLGRLLEWLMTGEVSDNMAARPVPRGTELSDEACDLLDRVIVTATQAFPNRRFRTVQEMIDQLPDLWFSPKPRPRPSPLSSTSDALVVWKEALDLARDDDMIGWRRLEHELRRGWGDHFVRWRGAHESSWRNDKEAIFTATDRLLEATGPRLVLSLAGVYSGKAALTDALAERVRTEVGLRARPRALLAHAFAVGARHRGGTIPIRRIVAERASRRASSVPDDGPRGHRQCSEAYEWKSCRRCEDC